MSKTLTGESPEVSGIFSTDPLVNLEHFDTNFMGAADCGYIVSTEQPTKKWILRGWNLRGLTWKLYYCISEKVNWKVGGHYRVRSRLNSESHDGKIALKFPLVWKITNYSKFCDDSIFIFTLNAYHYLNWVTKVWTTQNWPENWPEFFIIWRDLLQFIKVREKVSEFQWIQHQIEVT